MNKKGYYKKTLKNVMQILDLLKKHEKTGELLTISKISKLTGLHKWTVSRTLDLHMQNFVEITIPDGFEDVGLHIKFVRLKNPDITREQVLRFLRIRSLTF
jgi:DNA-binding IclR family transcriptional regulator